MTVKQLAKQFEYRVLCMPDPLKEVRGGYAGDLLSWVMGRMGADCAWVTIMSNVNIIAVATLTEPACIVLSEDAEPEEMVLQRAKEQGINVLATAKDTFSVCSEIASVI